MSRFASWQLFAVCVLVWGTTWYAITWQIADLAPEIGVALRFALAGATILAFAAWSGMPLRFSARRHARFALQGAFMYGVSYVCVYHAEQHVVSGLVAVGYSASPLLQGIGAALLFGAPLARRFVGGGLLGVAGVALMFWPEFGRAVDGTATQATALGVVFTVASVGLSAIGSLVASRNRHHGIPFWPSLGYGMGYGALSAALVAAVVGGGPWVWPTAPSWWISLAWLALAGSVLSFACYLTVQDRLGPGPAATVGVMTPLLALLVSLAFESFEPDLLTLLGAALAVGGNALMLTPVRADVSARGAAARE